MFSGFDSGKCKLQCIQGANRIQLNSNKAIMQLTGEKAKVAEYFNSGNIDLGMIRVDIHAVTQTVQQAAQRRSQIMNIEKQRAAIARIEVYLGLIQQRVEQLKRDKEIPPELLEAIASISYTAKRLEAVPELEQLRKTFERKYGPKVIRAMAGEGGEDPVAWGVSEQLIANVNPAPPRAEEWVRKGLAIAEENKVDELTEGKLYEAIQIAMPNKPRPKPKGGDDNGGVAVPALFNDSTPRASARAEAPHGGFVAPEHTANDFGNPTLPRPVIGQQQPAAHPVHAAPDGTWAAEDSPTASRNARRQPPLIFDDSAPGSGAAPLEGKCNGGFVSPRQMAPVPPAASRHSPQQEGSPTLHNDPNAHPRGQVHDEYTAPGHIEDYFLAMSRAQKAQRGQEKGAHSAQHDSGTAAQESSYGDYVAGQGGATAQQPDLMTAPPPPQHSASPPRHASGGLAREDSEAKASSWSDLPAAPSTGSPAKSAGAAGLPDAPQTHEQSDLPTAPRFSHTGVLFEVPSTTPKEPHAEPSALAGGAAAQPPAGMDADLAERMRRLQNM